VLNRCDTEPLWISTTTTDSTLAHVPAMQQLATPLERLRHNATSSGPVCYYVDWITKSCMIGSSVEQCAQIKAGQVGHEEQMIGPIQHSISG
jgi:hypothetical protein